MIRKVVLFLLVAGLPGFAQSKDALGGLSSVTLSGHPAKQAATCSQSSTTQTCTVTTGSAFLLNEPIVISGSGTAMDWVFDGTDALVGASKITNIVGNTLTLTAHASATAGSTAGTIAPAFYYPELKSGRWWLANPFNHGMFVEGVGPITLIGTSKYGCAGGQCTAAANAIFSEMKSWNFNAIGNDVSGFFSPVGGSCSGACGPLPQLMNDSGDLYSIIATIPGGTFAAYGTHPVKDLSLCINPTQMTASFASFLDYFDSGFSAFLTQFFAGFGGAVALSNNPMIIGVSVGSADQFYGLGAGPDFDTVPAGRNQSDMGLLVSVTSPLLTFTSNTAYAGLSTPYADPKNYSRTGAAYNPYGNSTTGSPPATCQISTPCTYRDYMAKKYGTIGALNTAWGTSYTTFDSSATVVTAETFGTGTGVQLTFNHTFASTPDPNSIQIKLAGTVIGGDCPAFRAFNPCAAGTGKGFLGGTNITLTSSSVTYATGVATIVFSAAPVNGAAITVNYTHNGWGPNGTGLMDEDGRSATLTGHNGICLLPVADPTTPGTDGYACRPGNPGSQLAPDANATFAADVEGWISQYVSQYESSIKTSFKAVNPHLLLFSPETTGTWGAPPNRRIIDGMAPYVDVSFHNVLMTQPSTAQGQAMYAYMSKEFTGPMFNLDFPNACNDSATAGVELGLNCSNDFNQATQPLRAAQYYSTVNAMLNNLSFNSTHQWIGLDWWQLHDNDGPDNPMNNWGLCDASDNCYNAHDAVAGTVACAAPLAAFTCGSEPAPGGSAVRPFGDLFGGLTGVTAANALWFGSVLAAPLNQFPRVQ